MKKQLKQLEKHRDIQRTKHAYSVFIDWYSVEKGGRKYIPTQGIYYCTTDLAVAGVHSWSIALKMDELSKNEALLWFLFHHEERQIEIGQMLNLFEGARCVGQVIVHAVYEIENLSFWFEVCKTCDQGRMQIYIDERYSKPFLCCDVCYDAYYLPVVHEKEEFVNIIKIKNHFADLIEIQHYNLCDFALKIYKK